MKKIMSFSIICVVYKMFDQIEHAWLQIFDQTKQTWIGVWNQYASCFQLVLMTISFLFILLLWYLLRDTVFLI